MNKKPKEMPVYLFTGFLESGKTKFIQETLEDKRFCNKEKTLLLVCEEGEEEYAPEQFATDTVVIRVLEGQEQLTTENLTKWAQETKADRVVIEYNGMWLLDALYAAMPEGWVVYQEFMFADAGTFLSYNGNMRQLVYDKLKSCELVVFNRFKPDMDKMEFHKVVRAASRRADIAYESTDGKVVYDDIEDPLPFDLNAPVIEIGDADFAEWYRDLGETPANYEGKTVRFKCRALKRSKMPANTFIVGRHVMTCCVEDIQFAALVCQWDEADTVQDDSWMILTAKLNFKFNKAYGRKGPVLSYVSHELCEAPEQPVATFY
ncbi:MAG: GTPase [Candidatus Limivicinus sp.]|nr:GTPase [Clostridiales bacterium]MDY4224043.1 GTPase [Candidatus Limivicinus sp.]MDY5083479.1 GTPase [Candidatus Limivicinus sp.]